MEDMIRILIEDDAPRFPRIPKVPLFMRIENQNMSDDFDPKVVSLCPYHHGKPELKFVEDFKPKSLQVFIQGSNKDEDFFLREILGRIDKARSCYLDEFTDKYSDDDFARMMLLDACLTLNIIRIAMRVPESEVLWAIFSHLGSGVFLIIGRDMYLLENQVPFWILKLVFNLRFSGGGSEFLESFGSVSLFGLEEPKKVVNMEPQPSHLLELYHRVLVDQNGQSHYEAFKTVKEQRWTTKICRPVMDVISKGISRLGCLDRYCSKNESIPIKTESSYVFRSVMELKSKGIRFISSGYGSLMNVKFTSHCYYAKVALPCWYVSLYTKVFFQNMIAYELCPGSVVTEESVSGYIYFMRTLIISPDDVKELREKNIINNSLGSDEEVVQVFRALSTYGYDYQRIFKDVKEKIEVHFNNKSKTWIAELLDTYFTSPWSLVALVAATLLLFLTFLQTYYASPFHSSPKGS